MNALSAFRAGLVLLLSLGTAGAYAQNVAQVFRDAKDNDATYAAARFALAGDCLFAAAGLCNV